MDDDASLNLDDNLQDTFSELICQNCTYFFHHNDDDDSMGICSLDDDFDPYWDDENLMEYMDFSCCRKLYLEKRFDGLRDACDKFESMILDIPEGMSLETYQQIEAHKEADSSELFQVLREEDQKIAQRAMNHIQYLIRLGNQKASENLIQYFMELGPATTLAEVHFRIEMVDILSELPMSEQIVDAYIRELTRTASNNTTRRLYSQILRLLKKYPQEEICAPLQELLSQASYSYKIKRRIKEVAGLIEPEDDVWWF